MSDEVVATTTTVATEEPTAVPRIATIIIYDANTKLVTGSYEISCLLKSDDILQGDSHTALPGNSSFRPLVPDGYSWFILKEAKSDTLHPADIFCDPATRTVFKKPGVKLEFDNPNPKVGDVVTVKVSVVDFDGHDLSDQNPCTMKMKDINKIASFEQPTMEFPAQRTFRIKSSFPGESIIRVKDSAYKLVPSFTSLKFAPPDF